MPDDTLYDLRDVLGGAYPDPAHAREIAQRAGVLPDTLPISALDIRIWWWDAIGAAQRQGRLVALVDAAIADPTVEALKPRFEALREPVLQVQSGTASTVGAPAPADGATVNWEMPVFLLQWVYPEEMIEQVEYRYEPGILPDATINDFFRLSRVELGELREADGSHLGFNIRFTLKNTDSKPMALDLDHRFFSLKDALDRDGELVYFCCPAQGVILPAGDEREIQVVFRAYPGWLSKLHGQSTATLEVLGLRPIFRAAWKLRLPVTAD